MSPGGGKPPATGAAPDRARWSRIKEIFAAAEELEMGARPAFVAAACGEDLELRREVEGLLLAHSDAGDFLGQPILLRPSAPITFAELDRIGPYQLRREIGRGGMGIVYLAEREDDFRKEVAIKVMAGPALGRGLERRFRAERQILAGLDHAYIARLLDGGITSDGRQYFVLEYVQGLPIDQYCDEHKLNVRERLELFCKVLEAVQFAHQKLVVHRDLKPSNLLVEEGGRPKLLDFGIAKLLSEGTGTPEASIFAATETGQWLLTPEYASPEQVRGEAISTASDVYSLGILLYELLTGHRPYELKSRRPDEVVRTVSEEEPARASTVVGRVAIWPAQGAGAVRQWSPEVVAARRQVSPKKLRRQLEGDLDVILSKAQHKDPARRYGSVQQFLIDIERHLTGLPLLARPDSASYRLLRWVRRNKRASAVLLVTTLFAVFASWQRFEVERERDLAQRRLETTERLTEFLVGLFEISDPGESRGETVTARELLDRSVGKLGELSTEPESRARFLETIGRVYLHLGLADRAEPLLVESLDLRRRFLPGDWQVADSLSHLGKLRLLQGRYAEAIAAHQEAIAIYGDALGPEHAFVATEQSNLGSAFFHAGRPQEAETCWLEALRLKKAAGPAAEQEAGVATDLLALGQLALQRGRLAEAETLLREALAALGPSGEDSLEGARVNNGLAVVLRQKGDLQGAEELYRKALEIREKRLGNNHPEVATTLNNLGLLRVLQGDLTGAEDLLRRSLEARRSQLGEQHSLVPATLINLGTVLAKLEKHDQAVASLREAVELRRKYQAPEFPDLAQALLGYGTALLNAGRAEEARQPLAESVAIFLRQLGQEDWRSQEAEVQLGLAEWRAGDREAGEGRIRRAARALLLTRPGQPEAKRATAALEELERGGSR